MIQAREKGRAAFKAQQWEEAIVQFTAVLEQNPSDVICLSIRSSAYQKVGKLTLALADAHQTIQVQPTYVRGYIRKACILRAMKEYSQEVENYLVGLEHCPANPSLLKGLQGAQHLKLYSSKASQVANMTQATKLAALSRLQKATRATTLQDFIQQSKKNLELEALALQAQLDLLHELQILTETETLDLVHTWLLSATPKISTLYDLVLVIQKASASMPFADQIHDAVERVNYNYLPTPQEDESLTLTRTGLETFLRALVMEIQVTMADILQYLVCHVLFPGWSATLPTSTAPHSQEGGASSPGSTSPQTIPVQHPTPPSPHLSQLTPKQKRQQQKRAVVKEKQVTQLTRTAAPKSILNDTRMQHLFVLFDKDSDATVDFKEVALGLYPLTKNMGEAAKNAAGLLLMVDKDDQRQLTYEQFARLILAVGAAFCMSFDDLADQLTFELAKQTGTSVDESIMNEIMVAEEAYAKVSGQRREKDQRKKTLDALLYNRTQKLFELWDTNHDGYIDFAELLSGLRRFHKAAMGSASLADAERDALMLMGYDDDHNQSLDTEEFAFAMVNYAENVVVSLHELIDFMCVVSSRSQQTIEYETKFRETTQARNFQPSMGTILDTADGDGGHLAEENEEGD